MLIKHSRPEPEAKLFLHGRTPSPSLEFAPDDRLVEFGGAAGEEDARGGAAERSMVPPRL